MGKNKLFVGNLTYSVNARDLSELFSRFGKVIDVNVLENRGYGFVEMDSSEAAAKAREQLSEMEFMGRKLLIDGVRPFNPSERRAQTKRKKQNSFQKNDKTGATRGRNTEPVTSWSHEKVETRRSGPCDNSEKRPSGPRSRSTGRQQPSSGPSTRGRSSDSKGSSGKAPTKRFWPLEKKKPKR